VITFVPTPIGNLDDISYRTLKVLEGAEVFLCEDTRVTKQLLHLLSTRFDTTFNPKEFISVHSHNEEEFLNKLQTIDIDKNIVYLSDAGMPCISDPGAKIVDFCIKNSIKYDVLPGANAALSAYAMSGFTSKEFLFYGFLPHKAQNRLQELEKIFSYPFITIIYESPKRVITLLQEISSLDADKTVFMVKEISKLYQKTYKDSAKNLLKIFENEKNIKGEWVVIIDSKEQTGNLLGFDDIKDLDIPPKQKAKLISKLKNISVKVAYEEILGKIEE
jgi:16S rRNA (cytidine1402-2'-O)-methyltransferase